MGFAGDIPGDVFYNYGDYLFTSERIRKIRFVILRTNGVDVDANAALAIQSSTADAITNVLPFQDWSTLKLGSYGGAQLFTNYLHLQINSLTDSTYWKATNATNFGLSLEC